MVFHAQGFGQPRAQTFGISVAVDEVVRGVQHHQQVRFFTLHQGDQELCLRFRASLGTPVILVFDVFYLEILGGKIAVQIYAASVFAGIGDPTVGIEQWYNDDAFIEATCI